MIIRHNTLVSLDRAVDSKYHNSLSKRPGTYFKISAKNDGGLLEGGRLVKESANLIILSPYYLYGKPGESGENSNGTVHPGRNFPEKKVIPFEVLPFPVLPKRPIFSVPFVWITTVPGFMSRESEKFTGIL